VTHVNSEEDSFTIEVAVRKDQSGRIQSSARMKTPKDEEISHRYGPSKGIEASVYGLVLHAIRLETSLQVLTLLSEKSENDIQKIEEGSLTDSVSRSLSTVIQHIVSETVGDTLKGIKGNFPTDGK